MDWNNWSDKIPSILETSDDWEKIFKEFYIKAPLGNSKLLVEKDNKLSELSKKVKTMIYIYKQFIPFIESMYPTPNFATVLGSALSLSRSNNLPIRKSKLKYQNNCVQIFPIDPFSLFIVPTEFTWINIIHGDHVPKAFTIEWDMSYFSEFQIKLASNANFKLDVCPLIEHKTLRFNGHMLYLFEASEQKEVINFTFTVLTDGCEKPFGDISISYGTERHETDLTKTQTYLNKLKKMMTNLQEFYTKVEDDICENLKDIERYKNEFKNKIQRTTTEEI